MTQFIDHLVCKERTLFELAKKPRNDQTNKFEFKNDIT